MTADVKFGSKRCVLETAPAPLVFEEAKNPSLLGAIFAVGGLLGGVFESSYERLCEKIEQFFHVRRGKPVSSLCSNRPLLTHPLLIIYPRQPVGTPRKNDLPWRPTRLRSSVRAELLMLDESELLARALIKELGIDTTRNLTQYEVILTVLSSFVVNRLYELHLLINVMRGTMVSFCTREDHIIGKCRVRSANRSF